MMRRRCGDDDAVYVLQQFRELPIDACCVLLSKPTSARRVNIENPRKDRIFVSVKFCGVVRSENARPHNANSYAVCHN